MYTLYSKLAVMTYMEKRIKSSSSPPNRMTFMEPTSGSITSLTSTSGGAFVITNNNNNNSRPPIPPLSPPIHQISPIHPIDPIPSIHPIPATDPIEEVEQFESIFDASPTIRQEKIEKNEDEIDTGIVSI